MTLSKESMRKEIQLHLGSIDEDKKKKWNNAISKNISQLFSDFSLSIHDLIGAFAPMSDEIDWIFNFQEKDYNFAFPGIKNKKMSFFKSRYTQLELKNDFGAKIQVPPKNSEEAIPSILLIPGIAFSKDGNRLGRGKGFYDRYLSKFTGIKVGLCYEVQIKESLPTEGHDQRVDYIITPNGMINCKEEG
ncbi:MAG: 5-formyltetrahydrofolate cyclo-ligase [Bdellovibrionales bacterium]|jgi:5-formyltetrahydrofolate cyclo-ligase|nr:5-formyltetrahydrofolate cyclo-ligase [Bdellovibrionales bacterium]